MEDSCPVPLEFLGIQRTTWTDILDAPEAMIQDLWRVIPNESDNNRLGILDPTRRLSAEWIGRTCLDLLKPKPEGRHVLVEGRKTRQQKTSRPPNVWPETWSDASRKQRKKMIQRWEAIKPVHEEMAK